MAACLAACSLGAQTVTIFSEGFEGAFPGDWQVGDYFGGTTYWGRVNSAFGGEGTHSGSYKAYCAGQGYYGTTTSPKYRNDMDAYLGREIDLTGYTNVTLTFWFKVPSIESTGEDYCSVWLGGSEVWTRNSIASGWTQATLNLNAYAGAPVWLEFEFYTDEALFYEGFYLDDIQVTGVFVGPNLTPHQPAGWADKLVISGVPGTVSNTVTLYNTNALYVDWAIRNTGPGSVPFSFGVDLLLDGNLWQSWYVETNLTAGSYFQTNDCEVGMLSPGTHTLTLVADLNGDIVEASEADNSYSRTITLLQSPTGDPPSIMNQSDSQIVMVGDAASFWVALSGPPPFFYQWRFNGATITRATNNSYEIGVALTNDAGSYSVVVSNLYGATASSSMDLTVEPLPTSPELGNALDGAGLVWHTGGDAPWFSQTAVTHDLVDAAQSGPITDDQVSWVQTIVNGPGTLSWWWRVSSEDGYDWLSFYLDGGEIAYITGEVAWQMGTYSVPTGRHLLRWAYFKDLTDSAGQDQAWLDSVSFSASPVPPFIAIQPKNSTNNAGGSAAFSVTATGTAPLTYRWRQNGTNLVNGGRISGADTSLLVISGVQASNMGNYVVVVTNSYGAVTSAVATLTVNLPTFPVITQHPQSRTNVAGTIASFSVTAEGRTPLAFQWRFNGVPLASQTGTNLTLASVQSTNEGNYDVVVTNVVGSVTSAVAVLTVWVRPAIAAQPRSQTNLVGTTASFSVVATGTEPLSYQWRFGGTDLPGETASTLLIYDVQTNHQGPYVVVVGNLAGVVTSSPPALLTVLAPPVIVEPPQDQAVMVGDTAVFSVVAVGTPPLSYRWWRNGTLLASGGRITGANSNVLTIATVNSNDAGSFVVMVSNAVGSVTSDPVMLVTAPTGLRTRVVAWGDSGWGQTNVPIGLFGVVTVAAGTWQSLALRQDGTVAQWDDGADELPTNLNSVVALDGGGHHNLALLANGSVREWASGAALPVGLTNILAIATGSGGERLALKANGKVKAWGEGSSGQANVPPDLAGVVAVAGNGHCLALKSDGTVVAWGDNSSQQTNVPTGLSDVIEIAAGNGFSLALKTDGTVVKWGDSGPELPPEFTNVVAIAAGDYLGLALRRDGTFVQWNSPFGDPPPGLSNVVKIAAGYFHGLALTATSLPPVVYGQPRSQRVAPEAPVQMRVEAVGTVPLRYRWFRNGAPISGATNAWCFVPRASNALAGSYTVTVSNFHGVVTSSVAVLTVDASMGFPSIVVQPTDRWVALGDTATFGVEAEGSPPFRHQWLFNGAPLAGATNAQLVLTNLQYNRTGLYAVRVTNAYGAVLSSNATLTVTRPLAEALDTTGIVWTTSPPGSWIGQTAISHDNVDAAQTLPSSEQQSVTLQATLTGPGTLTFWWKATDGYMNCNWQVYTDSGTDWQQASVYIDSGVQSPYWNYSGAGAGWLDQVRFTPGAVVPIITAPPASRTIVLGGGAQFYVSVTGTGPYNLQWQHNGTNLPGATGTWLTLANVLATQAGDYRVIVSNDAGAVTSAPPAVLTVVSNVAVTFLDPALESVVRSAIYRPSGAIMTEDLLGLSYLWANWSGITNLTGLEHALNLRYLYLSGNPLTNTAGSLAALGRLPQLQGIGLYATSPDLAEVAALTNLLDLNLGGNSISNLNSLAPLHHLQQLFLHGNRITDLTPLAALSTLTNLILEDNQISNASPLSNLVSLSTLDLSRNRLSDAAPRAALSNLTRLSLGNNSVTNLIPLAALGRLQYLGLYGNHISALPPLSGMTALTALDLSVNSITNLAGVDGATKLRELILYNNQITDLSPVRRLTNLLDLNLAMNFITNLAGIEGCVRLQSLGLAQNQLADLGPLRSLTNLTGLSASWNSITNLTPLAGLSRLTTLDISGNPLGNLNTLSGLPRLTTLYVNYAGLTSVAPLAGMTSLASLGLSGNALFDITQLSALTNLSYLELIENALTNINPLTGLTNLGQLHVTYNYLDLSSNSPAANVIQTLRARGAYVSDEPQRPIAPVIVEHPQGQTISAGSTVTLFVTAEGLPPLHYRWLCDGTNLPGGPRISGVTATNLTITGVRSSDAGGYTVVVTNVAGSVTSEVAVLTVTSDTLRFAVEDGGVSVTNGMFHLPVAGPVGSWVVLEASWDLQTWDPVQTNLLTADVQHLYQPLGTNRVQFFRARLGP